MMQDWDALGVRFRRDLHQIPELAFQETRTQAYLKQALAEMGISARPLAGTGLVADIDGRLGHGKKVALRADMDGLPISEETDEAFASQHPGVMHACGHDGHMAILLTAAGRLHADANFRGTVRLIFQPSEERIPGGAVTMIAEGALNDVDEIYGLHLWGTQKTGSIELAAGPQMANADEFRIHVKGRGGHGSEPESTADAVLAASQIVVNLQTIVSRRVSARDPVVVSCGTIAGGSTFNIIAEAAEITGTVRTYDAGVREQVARAIDHIARTTAALSGSTAEVEYLYGYPAVVNHPQAVERWLAALDPGLVVNPAAPKLGAEDFSYYLQNIPGAFLFLGAEPESGPVYPQHSSHLRINEDALKIGREAMIAVAKASLAS